MAAAPGSAVTAKPEECAIARHRRRGRLAGKCCIWNHVALNATLMSKGHGSLQRSIMAVFAGRDDLLDSISVAGLVFDQNPVSAAQASSTRRALQKLVAEGALVDLGRGWNDKRRRYATPARAAVYDDRLRALGPL